MQETISFTQKGANGADAGKRHLAAAAAMRRYLPHVVAWHCPRAGAPISVTLPESLSVGELLRRVEQERLQLAAAHDPAAPDRVFQIHYAHLSEAKIEEGICRLGRCLVRYAELAAASSSREPNLFVGP